MSRRISATPRLMVGSSRWPCHATCSAATLARMRSAMVSETALAGAARRMGLGDCLLLGRGEESQGGRDKNSVLSDALEAVLGAVYLDGGLEAASERVKFLFEGHWPSPPETFRPRDFKSLLQDIPLNRNCQFDT